MNIANSSHLWKWFSYNKQEREAFDYIDRYMRKILIKRAMIESDGKCMRRFLLAGLYLDYRAYNHMGYPISTKDACNDPEDPQTFRLYLFRQYTGEEIIDTNDYLQKMGMSYWKITLMTLRILRPSTFLYKFVMGRKT